MPSSVAFDLESYRSAHCAALDALAVQGDKFLPWWPQGYPRPESMALETIRVPFQSGFFDGDESIQLRFELDAGISADLLHSCFLEVRAPRLEQRPETLASYVWGLGYSLFERARFVVDGEVLEDLTSTYLEMRDELMSPPGRVLQEAVWKYDNVTVPELAALSQSPGGCVLYIPLRFFWAKGTTTGCVLPIKPLIKAGTEVKIVVQLRRIEDICYELPVDTTQTQVGVPRPANKPGSAPLEWSDFTFQLWVGGIYCEPDGDLARNLATQTYTAVVTTPEYLSRNDEGEPLTLAGTLAKPLPFRLPSTCLMWAVADQSRLTRPLASGTSDKPYDGESGVRSLFGTRPMHHNTLPERDFTASEFDVVSYANIQTFLTDWNALRPGDGIRADLPQGEFAIVPQFTVADTSPLATRITVRYPNGHLLGQYDIDVTADNTTINKFERVTNTGAAQKLELQPPSLDESILVQLPATDAKLFRSNLVSLAVADLVGTESCRALYKYTVTPPGEILSFDSEMYLGDRSYFGLTDTTTQPSTLKAMLHFGNDALISTESPLSSSANFVQHLNSMKGDPATQVTMWGTWFKSDLMYCIDHLSRTLQASLSSHDSDLFTNWINLRDNITNGLLEKNINGEVQTVVVDTGVEFTFIKYNTDSVFSSVSSLTTTDLEAMSISWANEGIEFFLTVDNFEVKLGTKYLSSVYEQFDIVEEIKELLKIRTAYNAFKAHIDFDDDASTPPQYQLSSAQRASLDANFSTKTTQLQNQESLVKEHVDLLFEQWGNLGMYVTMEPNATTIQDLPNLLTEMGGVTSISSTVANSSNSPQLIRPQRASDSIEINYKKDSIPIETIDKNTLAVELGIQVDNVEGFDENYSFEFVDTLADGTDRFLIEDGTSSNDLGLNVAPLSTGIQVSLSEPIDFELVGLKALNVHLANADNFSTVFALLNPLRLSVESTHAGVTVQSSPADPTSFSDLFVQSSTIDPEYVQPTTNNGLVASLRLTGGDPAQHRNDGLNACPFLHMNRWDYRACVGQADEAEPLKRVRLKLANEPRWHADLEPEGVYFRAGVQAPQHFSRVPRKGIYAYSFANSGDRRDEGFCNLGRLHNKKLELDANKAPDTLARLHMFSEGINIFECNPLAGTARLLQKRGAD